jgi:hypothetical protein
MVAGVLLLIGLLIVIGAPAGRRALQREKADQLREEAEEKLIAAARREAAARTEEATAHRERLAAEQAMKQADAIDPDLRTGSGAEAAKRQG